MISCKTLIHQSNSHRRYVEKHPQEGPVCFQLAGNNPAELAEAVKRITNYGADLIDLNCGCPVKKIRSKGAGSKLLTDPQTLYKLIVAMKQNTHLPVSIKIRVEGRNDEKFNSEIAQIIREGGADFVVVHGRHWTEHYETACRYDDIQFFVEQLPIPVIGNGDIACIDSLKKMLATGCAGVMISRAGMGQPWLIKKLIAEMQNEKFVIPSAKEIGALFVEHVELLSALLENDLFAILQARKFAKYYARNLPHKIELLNALNNCHQLQDFTGICAQYFI